MRLRLKLQKIGMFLRLWERRSILGREAAYEKRRKYAQVKTPPILVHKGNIP